MPATYNGIGTHYYGRKNEEKRPGTCQQCGRSVVLASYDTRLWFVVFFIPIIPLGRKRIVEYCPACTRHYVLDLQKWETTKQLEISGALDKFRSQPTPEAAIEVHQALVNFHQSAQAAEFRQVMQEKFADNARVQAYLGAILVRLGRLDEATPRFERALALRPDLPEARVGVAEARMRAGRPDEARPLLDFLEKPGAAQLYSLAPLETLARSFQQARRHQEALDLLAKLIEALPSLADHTGFRKLIENSEKALGRSTSMLPKRKFSWRRLLGTDPTAPRGQGVQITWRGVAVAGALLLLVCAGFAIRNEYVRRHRTLHVVNQLRRPATVEIRGAGKLQANPGVSELVLPEGRYRATVTVAGAPPEELDLDLATSYFDRFANHPVWVVNVGGEAILMVTTAIYSSTPQPPGFAFRVGQPFEYFPDVDYAFTPLPETQHVKAGEQRVLNGLDFYHGRTVDMFHYFDSHGQPSEALRLAETHLRWSPEDHEMLQVYSASARRLLQTGRVETYLRPGLTNRPVRVGWHRAYQSLRKDRKRDAQLALEYDAMLQADPTNSSLLYLRGRVSPDHAEARRFFERARTLDPQNSFPVYALGYEEINGGNWSGGRELFARAVELAPGEALFRRYLRLSRLALGEFAALEQEERAEAQRNHVNPTATVGLCDALIAAGKDADAQKAVQSFTTAAVSRYGDDARETCNAVRNRVLYATGDFAGMEKAALTDRSPAGRRALFQARVELGRVAEAVQAMPTIDNEADEKPFQLLSVALAWGLAGNAAEAQTWQDRALRALDEGDDDYVRAAALLRRPTDLTPAELDGVVITISSKAVLLAFLAQQHPNQRASLAAAARRLNVERVFPYHLIQRATAAAAATKN
jgi:tetratricopeptide (TPR) repeat protein